MSDLTVKKEAMESWLDEVKLLTIQKGWRTEASGALDGHEFAAYIALLHSEASEALEAYRDKIWSETCNWAVTGEHHKICSGKNHGVGKPVGVGPEMADTFIRLLDMCSLWNVDLVTEIERVMEFNWNRPYRHGGRDL